MESKERISFDEAVKLVTRQETVTVKPIVRERAFFKKGSDGEFMFTGTRKVYQLPYSNGTRSYVKIFDNSKEQEAFEVIYNVPAGSLNLYDRKNPFWLKFEVELTKDGKELDLTIPSHVLEYKVLKSNVKRIAQDWASRHRGGLEFALVNEKQVREDDNRRADITEKAMDLFMKVRKSNSNMFNALRLLEKNPPKESIDKTDFLKTELLKVIEQRERSKNGIKSIYDFIEVLEDKRFETKVLIYDAMDAHEINISNGMFKLAATEAVMGKSISQAADWLDDLQNQEDKIILQQRLKK